MYLSSVRQLGGGLDKMTQSVIVGKHDRHQHVQNKSNGLLVYA